MIKVLTVLLLIALAAGAYLLLCSGSKEIAEEEVAFRSCEDEARVLTTSRSSERRSRAAARLEGCSPKVAVPSLISALSKEDDSATAWRIALTIRKFPQAQRLIYPVLSEPDPRVRANFAGALWDPDLSKSLFLLTDPDPDVRISYAYSLCGFHREILLNAAKQEKDPLVRSEMLHYAKPVKVRKLVRFSIKEILAREARTRSFD